MMNDKYELKDMVYGKANIRVARAIKGPTQHQIRELTVSTQIGGKRLEKTFYDGDNSDVIATDTMKNVTFVLASQHSLESIESFALYIAKHFFDTYKQVDNVSIKIKDHSWSRMNHSNGTADPYTFVRGGPELRFTELTQYRGKSARIVSGFTSLEVLKTCGSAFKNFDRCKHTTLPEAEDRLLSTSINCRYEYIDGSNPKNDFNAAYIKVKSILLEQFAKFVSLSVQQLLYRVGVLALEQIPTLNDVWFQMPNLHFYYFFDKTKNFDDIGDRDTMIAFTVITTPILLLFIYY